MTSADQGSTTIFAARRIVTMNPSNPVATHVAVREGRILGVGSFDDCAAWGSHHLDETFRDHVLVPGFVEAHSHLLEGAVWALEYVGFFPRTAPDGRRVPGSTSIDELIDRLRMIEAGLPDDGSALVCWGLDPIYFPGERLTATHLDQVSRTRPIFVMHASFHVATVNTAMLERSGIGPDTETEGVVKDEHGLPVGELQEAPAVMLTPVLGTLMGLLNDDGAYWRFGAQARNSGTTTITDLTSYAIVNPASLGPAERVVNDPGFPARLVQYCQPAFAGAPADSQAVVDRFRDLQAGATDKLRYGGIKLVADGSIQGYTAVLNWPGYITGAPNGLWQVPPDRLPDLVRTFHEAGINLQVHCNGDAVVDAFIDAVDHALRGHAWLDHRHTVQHCQLTTQAQFRKMANLGMCGNLFANHLWFWGDQHHDATVGPERAGRMEACATALRCGVPIALHSDAAVTPLGQLHSMWCAVNRVTPSGRVLGEAERISAADALHAVTLGPAYQMHLDHEIGSIEVGKRADFAVLAEDPLEVDPLHLRDIEVWGTVLGGVPFRAGDPLGS